MSYAERGGILQRSCETEYSYDAWGRLRNLATQVAYTPGSEPALFLGRGYTGHEHLPWFRLINMNARLYDAALGRFLSPDPYVQIPDFTQNFNRYSYCVNNPLIYTDPSGEWFLIDDLIAAVIGGVINLTVNLVQGNVTSFGHGAALFGNGFLGGVASLYVSPIVGGAIVSAGNSALNQGFTNGWGNINWMQVGISGTTGAATSYLGGQLGDALSKPISNLTSDIASPVLREAVTQSATNAATGFALSAGFAWGSGASFEEGLKQGGQGALMGAGIGAMTGTVAGVKYARENNLNPWTGGDKLNSNNMSNHAQQRIVERNVSQNDINDAIKNPSKITDVKYDSQGRPSVKYIGNKVTVVINPETGNIITIYPTSTQRINAILKTKKRMKVKINITREEYNYLINNLLKDHKELLSELEFFEKSINSIDIHLEEDVADDIRELAGDEVGLHFDANYEPTEEGWILEHFIDKFYMR